MEDVKYIRGEKGTNTKHFLSNSLNSFWSQGYEVQLHQILLTCATLMVQPLICPLLVDHTRVKLTLATAKNDSEYINASFITVN